MTGLFLFIALLIGFLLLVWCIVEVDNSITRKANAKQLIDKALEVSTKQMLEAPQRNPITGTYFYMGLSDDEDKIEANKARPQLQDTLRKNPLKQIRATKVSKSYYEKDKTRSYSMRELDNSITELKKQRGALRFSLEYNQNLKNIPKIKDIKNRIQKMDIEIQDLESELLIAEIESKIPNTY